MKTKADIQKITSSFSSIRKSFINVFNPIFLSEKAPSIRTVFLSNSLKPIIINLKKELTQLPISDLTLQEITNLQENIAHEVKLKNTNKQLNKSTKSAIIKNYRTLMIELNSIKDEYIVTLDINNENTKAKYSDIKLTNNELALFITLASKYGLISEEVSETDKANSFSTLTNFSPNTLRNKISGEYKFNHHLLNLKDSNLDNLSAILDDILKHIDSLR